MRSIINNKYLGFFLVISVFLGSCDDFLEVTPPYTQDAENFFLTQEDYERALVGCYDLLQASYLSVWVGEIASDNSIAGGESVNDTEGLHQIDQMTHGGVNNELRNLMQWNYTGITRVNYLMENKDNIDFIGKDKIIAEARFLRAYYYFQLVKVFGDVPLIIDQRLGVEEATNIPRAPKSAIYTQIEKDLIAAIAVLEPTVFIKGKISQGAAKGLLGKVYLYQAKYTEAAIQLREVIASNQYSLLNNFDELFEVNNENHSETVFDIQHSGLEGGGYGCLICLEGNVGPGFQGIRQYNGPVYGDGNSYNLPTQNLYDAYSVADPRRTATLLDIDAFIAAQPNAQTISYAIGAGGHTGYYNHKYIKKIAELGLPDNDLTSPVNYIVIRYADILLMAAEALYQNGDAATAEQYVNQIRTRSNMPNISLSSIEAIWNERRLELAMEGQRFFDWVRTGQAATAIDGFQPNKHELFPIPQIEIDLAGGNWSQNPGY